MASLEDRLSDLSGCTYRAVDGPSSYGDIPPYRARRRMQVTTVKEEGSSTRAIPLMLLLIAVICIGMLRKGRDGERPKRPASEPPTLPMLYEDDHDNEDPLFQPL